MQEEPINNVPQKTEAIKTMYKQQQNDHHLRMGSSQGQEVVELKGI